MSEHGDAGEQQHENRVEQCRIYRQRLAAESELRRLLAGEHVRNNTMVTAMVTKHTTCLRSRGGPPRYLWWPMLIVLMAVVSTATSQNLHNRGKINNTGTIRVKSAANGLPDTVNGTFGFYGSDQSIPARQYRNLDLTGSGMKLVSGSLTIAGTVSVAPAVTLQIPSGSLMQLGSLAGRLTEQGYVSGHIQKQENLANSGSPAMKGIRTPSVVNDGAAITAGSTDMGGMGVTISWGTNAPGQTTVDRYSSPTSFITAGGNRSINRYYDISSAVDSSLDASLTFAYSSDEITGFNPATLQLWRSPDHGATWRLQRSTHNSSAKSLTRSGIRSFGRWTAADGTNPLGSLKYEWEADTLHLIAGNQQQKPSGAFLDSLLVVRVTDAFNQPVAGSIVTFAVTAKPGSATGDSLTSVSGVSDANGLVTTQFRLGSVSGAYEVTAQVTGVAGAITKFTAQARSKASQVQLFAGNSQQDSVRSLLTAFQVIARDDNSNAVQGVRMEFAVVGQPVNAVGTLLSKSVDSTDLSGIARTQLRLGNKSGDYLVEVYSPDASTVRRDTFRVKAVAGLPQIMWTQQSAPADTIGSTIQNIAFGITDADTNGVVGRVVNFSVAGRPVGTTGDSLFVSTAPTGTSGYASTQLRLGDKAGWYQIDARLAASPNLSAAYPIRARNGRPASLVASSASMPADTIGASVPSFTGLVVDRMLNPVPNVRMNFVVTAKPLSATGDTLSLASGVTDSSGGVSTMLTLGTKVGLYRVTATSDTVPGSFAEFSARANAGALASMDSVNFTLESKPILEALDSSFTVRLADRGDNPLSGETVRFSIVPALGSTGHQLSDSIAVTDSLGLAKTRLTIGSRAGIYTVVASSSKLPGQSRSFTARALPGAARTIASMTPDQSKPILSFVDSTLAVVVLDKGNNPVPGAMVTYSILSTPAGSDSTKLSADTAYTSVAGLATSRLKIGTKVGTYVVLARTPALAADSIRFAVRAVHGAATTLATVSAAGDTAEVGQKLKPFAVTVYDLGMNPVPKMPVQFTVTSQPAGAIGQFLTVVADSTDSLGRVSTLLTLGDRPGVYEVEAAAGSLAKVKFTAIATFTIGDPNSSGQIDIADLTKLIDHAIGAAVMAGVDSARSDLNRDGAINVLDIVMLRNRLLTDQWFVQPNSQLGDAPVEVAGPLARRAAASDEPANTASTDASVESARAAASTFGWLEATNTGVRFNMQNDLPVKGIQIILTLKNPVTVTKPDVIFPRANMMNVLVNTNLDTVRVVVFNMNNSPIQPDSGALFRLNIKLSDTSEVKSSTVIISTGANVATYLPSANVNKSIPLLPKDWVLYQNYPNPFNPSTTIEYEVPEINGKVARVAIQIFNILGEKVRTIDRAHRDAGKYKVTWDGNNDGGMRVASGVYIYRLLSPDHQVSKKMIMLK